MEDGLVYYFLRILHLPTLPEDLYFHSQFFTIGQDIFNTPEHLVEAIMDTAPHTSTTDVAHLFPQQKLKNTCDMCAASKVMCDKMKPICGRCERLRYPCFYSPARRVPKRRRCIQSISSGNKSEVTELSPELEPSIVDTDESVTSKFKALDDSGIFNFGDEMNGLNGFEWLSSTFSVDDTSLFLQNDYNHDKGESATMESVPNGSECGQSSSSKDFGSDCASIAMNILQHLNTTNMKELATTTPFGGTQSSTIDALVNTASTNIKRVSTMLICPCSGNTDVGLLVAAVCAAILDTYELVLRNSIRSKTISSSTEEHGGDERTLVNSTVGDVEQMDICTEALQDGSKEKAAIMQILEELPRVANLITQFTKRYGQDAEECATDLPQALAASMTCRLKAVIDEVTNWVARI